MLRLLSFTLLLFSAVYSFSQTCPLQISLVSDTVACLKEFPPPRGMSNPKQFSVQLKVISGTPTSIVWSNGNVGATLNPEVSGTYEVVATDVTGCKATAKVNIRQFGIPNPIYSNAGILAKGFCLGDSIEFTGIPVASIDKMFWMFGDGSSSSKQNPKKIYSSTGTFITSLRLTNRCGLDTTIYKQIKIFPSPPKPNIPLSTALCTSPIALSPSNNSSIISYLWSTGVKTSVIVVDKPDVYSLLITDINGCTSSSTTIVVDNRPSVDLGSSLTLCQFSLYPSLNAQAPGAIYLWSVNGVPNGNSTSIQAVNTSLPGDFLYSVKVVDPITSCLRQAEKQIMVYPTPSRPTITLKSFNTLHSSNSLGNQWYKNGNLLSGSVDQDLVVNESGIYSVQTILNECKSALSDNFEFTITGSKDFATAGIRVFPNPFFESLWIESDLNENLQVTILDMMGRDVITTQTKTNEAIEMRELPSGLYLLIVNKGPYLLSKRIVKY
ncbi:MAG: T9SS type A sorting domain-containing protein [Bacteroidetes bacterium]|nr:T9SS type A sorting domain-containing protein [Bacteroidota bacterium]